jgi:ankyrin repeat protein
MFMYTFIHIGAIDPFVLYDTIALLILRGENVNFVSPDGYPALYWAVVNQNKVLKFIVYIHIYINM